MRTPAAGPVPAVPRLLVAAALATGGGVVAWSVRSGLRDPERLARETGWSPAALLAVGGVALALVLCALVRVARGSAGSRAAVRCAFETAVAVWLVTVLCLQPYDQQRLEVTATIAAGLLAGGLSLPQTWRCRLHRRLRWLDVAVFHVGTTLLLVELGLAALARVVPSPLFAVDDGGVRARIAAHALAPGTVRFGFRVNARGFYDGEFLPRERRARPAIAVVGDSFGTSFVPHRYHYTTVAERELGNVDVYNLGVIAAGPDEYLQLCADEAMPLRPDAVVVTVFCGNDLGETRSHTAGHRLRLWFDRGNLRLFTIPSRWLRVRRAVAAPPEPAGGGRIIDDESELRAALPWLFDHRADGGTFTEAAYLELVRERLRTACSPDPRRVTALVRRLAEARRACGSIPFAVLLIPAEFQVEEELWRAAAHGERGVDRDEPQRAITRELTALGIEVRDLLPVLRALPRGDDGWRHAYRRRDTHFNVLGNAVAGGELAALVAALLR